MICNIPVYDSWGEEMKKISAYDKGVRVTILPDPDIGLVDLRLCFKVDFVLKNITESLKADSLDVSADEIQCTIPEKALQTRSGGTLDIYICLRNGAQQTTQYHAIVQVEGRPPLADSDKE